MDKKIRSISIAETLDKKLQEDSNYRGLTVSANITRILYEYFQNNLMDKKLNILKVSDK